MSPTASKRADRHMVCVSVHSSEGTKDALASCLVPQLAKWARDTAKMSLFSDGNLLRITIQLYTTRKRGRKI